jgi:hypothetical protein
MVSLGRKTLVGCAAAGYEIVPTAQATAAATN